VALPGHEQLGRGSSRKHIVPTDTVHVTALALPCDTDSPALPTLLGSPSITATSTADSDS
jgi:hypothetical protein